MTARPRCRICGGELYREDRDSPWRHVNLTDWAVDVHDAVGPELEAAPDPPGSDDAGA